MGGFRQLKVWQKAKEKRTTIDDNLLKNTYNEIKHFIEMQQGDPDSDY